MGGIVESTTSTYFRKNSQTIIGYLALMCSHQLAGSHKPDVILFGKGRAEGSDAIRLVTSSQVSAASGGRSVEAGWWFGGIMFFPMEVCMASHSLSDLSPDHAHVVRIAARELAKYYQEFDHWCRAQRAGSAQSVRTQGMLMPPPAEKRDAPVPRS
jgi:hypothetical protein